MISSPSTGAAGAPRSASARVVLALTLGFWLTVAAVIILSPSVLFAVLAVPVALVLYVVALVGYVVLIQARGRLGHRRGAVLSGRLGLRFLASSRAVVEQPHI